MDTALDTTYCCPGETRSIEPAVHLARLAAGYAPCRRCPLRHDSQLVAPRRVASLSRNWQAPLGQPTVDSDAVRGVFLNQFTHDTARRLGGVLVEYLARCWPVNDEPLRVVLAHDGSDAASELHAAMAEGAQRAGGVVVELDATTRAGLQRAVARGAARGGVIVASDDRMLRAVQARFFTAGGQCVSQQVGGELTLGSPARVAAAGRPLRAASRLEISTEYLASYAPLLHGLRPLRVVVDMPSPTVWAYLRHWTRASACQLLDAATSQVGSPHAMCLDHPTSASSRLLHGLAAERAHLGVWLDGDGGDAQFYDEQGTLIDTTSLAATLAKSLLPSDDDLATRPSVSVDDGVGLLALALWHLSQRDWLPSGAFAEPLSPRGG